MVAHNNFLRGIWTKLVSVVFDDWAGLFKVLIEVARQSLLLKRFFLLNLLDEGQRVVGLFIECGSVHLTARLV